MPRGPEILSDTPRAARRTRGVGWNLRIRDEDPDLRRSDDGVGQTVRGAEAVGGDAHRLLVEERQQLQAPGRRDLARPDREVRVAAGRLEQFGGGPADEPHAPGE